MYHVLCSLYQIHSIGPPTYVKNPKFITELCLAHNFGTSSLQLGSFTIIVT